MFPEDPLQKACRLIRELIIPTPIIEYKTLTNTVTKEETKMREINYIYITADRAFATHNGVICFGYRHNQNGTIEIAACFCSPKDRFSKKKAHLIINGRMNNGKSVALELPEEFKDSLKYKDAVRMIMDSFMDDNDSWLDYMELESLPNWVYRLCDEYYDIHDATLTESAE